MELVSLSDSGDIRTVTHEYAAEHVHLAYASTVHGIQGETTDASIVGPGVDAAGLYVGMTRGRMHNEAIAVAHTDAAARDQIADSMMRGIPEVSIEDSIRAARTELGRAAREADGAIDDRQGLHNELRRRSAWMQAAMTKILEMDAHIAAHSSRVHARGTGGGGADWELARARLLEEYASRSVEYADLARRYAGYLQEPRYADVARVERDAGSQPTLDIPAPQVASLSS